METLGFCMLSPSTLPLRKWGIRLCRAGYRALGALLGTGVLVCCASSTNMTVSNDYPPKELGVLNAYTVDRLRTAISPRDFTFVFDPPIDTVLMQFKFLLDGITLYLERKDRTALREAIEKYLGEYEAQTLTREKSSERAYFGTTTPLMTWGILGSAHNATPTMRFEYQFITDDRPYFIIANRTIPGANGYNCPAVRIALSPAQCSQVMQYLDQGNLDALLEEMAQSFETFDTQQDPKKTPETDKNAAYKGKEKKGKKEERGPRSIMK
ncbi:hypothetical protein TPSea814_000772 [Treponema pallidum subsp. pallidum str. Sea 81-4]|nr:conserved hypothetical protein [Treponema pallidum subsp. pallidum str. Chicago]AHN67431.1 hypothetical protein TPSea814_000772 [Treponema pallidum subsp. pallidum str. Sea 81-4]